MTTVSRFVLTPLADLPTRPLHWLWHHYIPLGQLTLLEGPPGIGTSLLAVHLASCVSAGLPLPDGSPCQQGSVLFLAPFDSGPGTLASRLQAAGGDPNRVLPLSTIESYDTAQLTNATNDYRPFSLAHDLPLLEAAISQVHASLLILDPISLLLATVSASQRITLLAQLSELAQRTSCAILLLRPISTPSRTHLANPAHLSTSAARDPLLSACRSRLLLLPDPTDLHQNTLLLHCTKHSFGPHPPTLAVCIDTNAEQLPTLLWLGTEDDPDDQPDTASLSQQRQKLLLTLRESEAALDARTLARLCLQRYHTARKTLQRMLHDGQLVSPARGLYTTPGHLCLLHFPATASPVSTVPTNQTNISTPTSSLASPVSMVATVPNIPLPPTHPYPRPFESPVPTVASIPNQPSIPNVQFSIPEIPIQPPELPFEDRSPSVWILPPKEPEIYPGW